MSKNLIHLMIKTVLISFVINYEVIKLMFILPIKCANALELNIDELQSFMSESVGVTIYDKSWADQTPFVSKKIEKAELCADCTHMRIYFEPVRFFDVTLTTAIASTDPDLTAYEH